MVYVDYDEDHLFSDEESPETKDPSGSWSEEGLRSVCRGLSVDGTTCPRGPVPEECCDR